MTRYLSLIPAPSRQTGNYKGIAFLPSLTNPPTSIPFL